MRTHLLRPSLITLAGLGLACPAVRSAASLQLLPSSAPDGYDYVLGLADDGTVIGSAQGFDVSAPLLWAKSGAAYSIAPSPALPSYADGGELRWISADASLLAGFIARPLTAEGEPDQVPAVWSRSAGAYAAKMLPRLGGDGASETVVMGGSSSGARLVGQSGATPVAAVWRGSYATGYTAQALPLPAGAAGTSRATSISADGARAVGNYETAAGGQAAVWTEGAGVYVALKLQNLPGGAQSFAEVVSRDGTLAAGGAETALGIRPVTWRADTGAVTAIETLPGFEATVLAIAENKHWLGGRATDPGSFEGAAVLWNGSGQIFDLVALASGQGASFGGFIPESITGVHFVSGDRYTIVGTGVTESGLTQGFVLEDLALTTPAPEPGGGPVVDEPTTPTTPTTPTDPTTPTTPTTPTEPTTPTTPTEPSEPASGRRRRGATAEGVYAPWAQADETTRPLGEAGSRPRAR